MLIPFDDFGLQVGHGVAGSFSGSFEIDPRTGTIESITLEVHQRAKGGPRAWTRITAGLSPTHPLFDAMWIELAVVYDEQIATAMREWRDDAPARAAEKRLDDAVSRAD